MNAPARLMPRDRQLLADKAMRAAVTARLKAGKDLASPVCIYSICEAYGVRVRFNDINMEGMYQRSSPPRIHLSSKRPLVRRNYNCAHELGHHVLGHGSSIDELRENQSVRPWDVPEEYSADTFAAYTLMPTLGIRNAFAVRGLSPAKATPIEIFRIACQFGVGYSTLVTHLLWGEKMIGRSRAEALRKSTPQSLRKEILGSPSKQPLIVADENWGETSIDIEVGHLIFLPAGTIAHGSALRFVADVNSGRLFEAIRPGLARLDRPGGAWATYARAARTDYTGLAEFRHLEDDEDE